MLTLRTRLPGAALLATAALALVPGAAAATTPRQSAVMVCQATGDGSYVLVRVLSGRLQEYRRNPNNLVPAPASGCPVSVGVGTESIPTSTTPSAASPATTPAPAPPVPEPATPAPAAPAPAPATSTPATTAAPKAKAKTAPAKQATAPSASAVAGTTASAPALTRPTTYTGDLPAKLDQLPNTGNETALLLLFGADLLLLGAGLRLRARSSRR